MEKKRKAVVTTDPKAFGVPGAVLVVDPDEAAELGACEEPALSPEDAWDSNSDEAEGPKGA
jgi:hypothetical protein